MTDADKLYFPVNTTKVGTAGASYDTKKWTLHDWTKVEVRNPFPGTGDEGEL